MTSHKFRFGVQLSKAASRDEWVGVARKAEALGFSSLFIPDHFGDQLAPVPALMAAADATTELRVGTLVLDNDYRHPVVLAMEAATLDLLSGGRFELGLGAGWMRTDYEQSGIPYDSPAVRVDRFEEGLAIVKGLLATDEPFSFSGRHYTVTDHRGAPRPVQQPLPVLIGGGAPRVLALAGREADIVGINFNLRAGEVSAGMGHDGTAEMVERKLSWVRDGAGDRYDDIELNMMIIVSMVTDDRAAMAERIGAGFQLTPEQALDVPAVLVGTVEEIVDTLEARRDRFGFSYIVFQGPVLDAMAPVVAKLAGT